MPLAPHSPDARTKPAPRRRYRAAFLAAMAIVALIVSAGSAWGANNNGNNGNNNGNNGNPPVIPGPPVMVTVCMSPGANQFELPVPATAVAGLLNAGALPGPCPPYVPPVVIDYCPDALNPGIQEAGTECTVSEPVDACPDDLNPGVQAQGTTCIVASGEGEGPSDACPDDLNPGVQETGTTCITAAAGPGTADAIADAAAAAAAAAAAWIDPAVFINNDPTLGNTAAATTIADGAEVTIAGMAAGGGMTDVAGASTGGANGVAAATGTLPYTGRALNVTLAAGLLALLLGSLAFVDARRVAARRAA